MALSIEHLLLMLKLRTKKIKELTKEKGVGVILNPETDNHYWAVINGLDELIELFEKQ